MNWLGLSLQVAATIVWAFCWWRSSRNLKRIKQIHAEISTIFEDNMKLATELDASIRTAQVMQRVQMFGEDSRNVH